MTTTTERSTDRSSERPADVVQSWRLAPVRSAVPRRDDRFRPLVGSLLAPLAATTGPFLRTLAIAPRPAPVVVAIVGIGASVLTGFAGSRRWMIRLFISLLAGAAVVPFGGIASAVWLAMNLVLVDWSLRGMAPVPSTPTSQDSIIPVLALMGVATVAGRSLFATKEPLAITAAALLITLVAGLTGDALSRWARRFGSAVGTAVVFLFFTALGVIVVAVPWAFHRLLRIDPLTTTADRNWISRRRLDVRPSEPWTVESAERRLGWWLRVRRRIVPVLAVLVIGTLLVISQRAATTELRQLAVDAPAAAQGLPWWPEYRRAEQWALFDPGPASNALRYPPTYDFHSRYLNVKNGERRTWRPPECDCRRLTVWVYGGSTVFGLGQRDEHTIASELARSAWADGTALDVTNRGVLGDLNWEESQRFAWDVAAGPKPDLVIFFDGYNEIAGAEYRNDAHRSNDRWPVDWTAESFYDDVRWWPDWLLPFRVPAGAGLDPAPTSPRIGPEAIARRVTENYEHGRLAATATAERLGVSAAWFWQPDRYTKTLDPREPNKDAATEAAQRQVRKEIQRQLPAEVHDLTKVYDTVNAPIFYDDVHTLEQGAKIVADAMYRQVGPMLRGIGERSMAPVGVGTK